MVEKVGRNRHWVPFIIGKIMSCSDPHYHSHNGILRSCYNHCTDLVTDFRFWIGVTMSYPLEHYLWEHVWPFTLIMNFLGL